MGKPFARMLNEYAERFQGKLRVFSAVPPLSSAFIPLEKYRHFNRLNEVTLEAIRNNLSGGSIYCDVFSELNKHTEEKLFFGTDHHWTAKGAYHAYVAFCKAAGFDAVRREDMEHRVKNNFLGSFYNLTRDKTLKSRPDTFDYYIPATTTTAVKYGKFDFKPVKSATFCHACSGGNSYSTFVCGDNPLMKITTSNKNGRKAVVIKNSMGNAFSVYLISHYEEVWVMDFRYSNHNLNQLIEKHKINDLIFAMGMHAAMSNGTINMMRNLATQSVIPPSPPQGPISENKVKIKDSTSTVPGSVPRTDSLK